MGEITAEHVRLASARLEAQRAVGAAAITWQLTPRRRWAERVRAKAAYDAILRQALLYYREPR